MATADQVNKSIEPGSVPYGERQGLEEGVSQLAAGGPGAVPSAPGGGPAPLPSTSNPLSALASGEIDPGVGGGPLTTGLSVGPGEGPQIPDSRKERLKALAEYAASPTVRGMARTALKAYDPEGL